MEGGREEVMMVCRERASVEEGRVDEGKEGRDVASGGREGNLKGGSIFTNQPFTNRPLPLRL